MGRELDAPRRRGTARSHHAAPAVRVPDGPDVAAALGVRPPARAGAAGLRHRRRVPSFDAVAPSPSASGLAIGAVVFHGSTPTRSMYTRRATGADEARTRVPASRAAARPPPSSSCSSSSTPAGSRSSSSSRRSRSTGRSSSTPRSARSCRSSRSATSAPRRFASTRSRFRPGAMSSRRSTWCGRSWPAASACGLPLPQILERCLHEIYAERGWDLAAGDNVRVQRSRPPSVGAHAVAPRREGGPRSIASPRLRGAHPR